MVGLSGKVFGEEGSYGWVGGKEEGGRVGVWTVIG